FVAVKKKAVFFTGKVFAPKALFSAYNEMSIVVVAFCPRKCCRRIEHDPFSTKSDFTCFEHDPKNHIAEGTGERGANTGRYTRIGLHQSRNNDAAGHPCDCSADGYAVRDDEMLKINERSDDQERNENPVRNRDLPREPFPDRKEKECGNEFHRKIAECNFRPAICASAAKREPTH